jgi:hypothetical protein
MTTMTSPTLRLVHLIPVALAAMLACPGIAQAVVINPTPPDGGITVNMTENGGPVIAGAAETFAIYYGDFTAANAGHPITAQQVVTNWLGDMNGTDYLNIDSTYTGGSNGTASTDVTYNGSYQVPTNYLGNSLTDAQILQIVQDAKSGAQLPSVANAVYFVFTAPGIAEQQDSSACGWHNGDSVTNTIYSWVGPALGCDLLGGNVSGNPVGNEFTETGSHELFESLTDPFPNTGYTDNAPGHGEVGDVCVQSNFDGSLHGDHFDLQAIWTLVPPGSPTGGTCSEGVTLQVAVPEPGTLALLGTSLLGLAALRRRRQT